MLSHVRFFVTPRTCTHKAPLSMDVSSKNTGVDFHFLLRGSLPDPEMEPKLHGSLALARKILYHWPTWEVQCTILLRHLVKEENLPYQNDSWWYTNFFTLCLHCQLPWLCYYHNFSLLTTVPVNAKQITYSATLIIQN